MRSADPAHICPHDVNRSGGRDPRACSFPRLQRRPLSMDRMARDTGVSAPTVRRWLSVLEESHVISLLQPEPGRPGRRAVRTPKLCFLDSGLLCHLLQLESPEDLILSRHREAVVETFAVSEMLKYRTQQERRAWLSFCREHGGIEVDVIAGWKHALAVEVESSRDPAGRLGACARKYVEKLRDDKAQSAVFWLGDLTVTLDGTPHVGWRDWEDFLAQSEGRSGAASLPG